MNKHECSNCKCDFKYKSVLERHINNKKKKCIATSSLINNDINILNHEQLINRELNPQLDNIDNIDNTILIHQPIINTTTNNTEIINNISNKIDFNSIKNNRDAQIEAIEIILKMLKEENINKNSISNNLDTNIKLYSCKTCRKKFSYRQSLYVHNKNNSCKVISTTESATEPTAENTLEPTDDEEEVNTGTTLNDILHLNSHNTTNNNSNNSNTTNNNTNNITTNNITANTTTNIIININPFGSENLEHISIKDFKSIFKNMNNILYKLSNLIYNKNLTNMNFTKNNMNKNIITYLGSDMEIKKLSEQEFIEELKHNMKSLCIELFQIHKNNLTLDELTNYMKILLLYYQMLNENKSKSTKLKHNIEATMDFVFRNEDVKAVFKTIEKDLKTNPELKKVLKQKNKERIIIKTERLNDYSKIPSNENNDDKCLNKIKVKAEAAIFADKLNNQEL